MTCEERVWRCEVGGDVRGCEEGVGGVRGCEEGVMESVGEEGVSWWKEYGL